MKFSFTYTRVIVFACLLITAAAVPLFAQTSGTGAITGTITDSTGAVIPGAVVEATNNGTGQQRTVTTGADGTYNIGLLPPGVYSLKITANGFKTTEVSKLTVNVTETPVLDRRLEIGAQADQVTVEANAEVIQTTNASLGTVLGGGQVSALPLTTRNYTNVLALSAGVSADVTNASQLGKGGMNLSANGAGPGANNMQIDGQNVSSFTTNGANADTFNTNTTTAVPNPDALQEFKVQTTSYDAGYGRNSGANVNVVTKSGSNEYHGSAFEFFRNTVLNANDFFLNRAGKGKGVLNQNQYGGTFGGPIKKDRLFFFGSYQATSQKNGFALQGNSSLTLPPLPSGDRSNTAAFRAAVGAANCPANHLLANGSVDPRYNTLRGGVQVACDGSTISATSLAMLQAKLPDGSYFFPGSATGNFLATNISVPARYSEKQELINVDYVASSKHTLAAKFFNSYAPSTLPYTAVQMTPGFTTSQHYQDLTGLIKLTSVLTPSLVNEARISGHRDLANFEGNESGISNHQFGITPLSPLDFTKSGLVSFFIITGAYSAGSNSVLGYSYTTSNSFQAADQLSWTKGKHTLRAGFEAEQIRWYWNYIGEASGSVLIPTFADFLVGRAGCTPGVTTCTPANPGVTNGTAFSNISSTTSADALGPAGDPHAWRALSLSAFVNDDFKVSQRLTLNLGLRYEYFGMPKEIYGVNTNLWPSAILRVPIPGTTAATGSLAGWVVPNNYPGALLPGLTRADNDFTIDGGFPKVNLAPRFGFAWQPFGGNKFVLRGGYGFFYDRTPGYDMVFGVNNGPPIATPATHANQSNYPASIANPFFVNPGVNAGPPMYGTYPARWVNFSNSTSSSIQQQVFGPGWKTPLVQSWNLGTQWNFLPTWVLEVGYVGSHGVHLATSASYNPNSALVASNARPVWGLTTDTAANAVLRQPYLGFGVLNTQCSCFAEKYNSLQVTLRKQFSHGVQAQAAYTWSNTMVNNYEPTSNGDVISEYSTVGTAGGGTSPGGRPQRLSINYGWNLPFGNPKGVLGKLVTGWNLAGVTTIQGGAYLNVTDGRGGTIFGLASSRAQLAPGKTYDDLPTPGSITTRLGGSSGGCGYIAGPLNTTGTLNGATCASLSPFVSIPTVVVDGVNTNLTGRGNVGQGVILGPGQFNFDASLSKMTRVGGIREDGMLQFRAEFFNALNHSQFSNPVAGNLAVNAGTFGQITSTSVNPRLIQLALKYVF